MILWVVFAVVSAIVIAMLARPMLAEPAAVPSAAEANLAVYRDQLAEIEADRERGLISGEEAETARAELARRLIRRAEEAGENERAASTSPVDAANLLSPSVLAYTSAAAIPLISLVVYLGLGSPTLPGLPHAARMEAVPSRANVEELVAKVEEQLRKTPEDGRGWDAIAPVYLRIGRFDDAAKAFAQAIRLQGESPRRLRGFGEALVMANDGIVVEPARAAYGRLLELEPGSPDARFWVALADEQEGKIDIARKSYEDLLAGAPDEAPWKPVVEARLAAIREAAPDAAKNGGPPAGNSGDASPAPTNPATGTSAPGTKQAKGPTADDIAAAETLSAVERAEFINSMVARLEAKMQADPADFDGWLRLIRAYAVLGRKDDARRALEQARKSAGDNPERTAELDRLSAELGLET